MSDSLEALERDWGAAPFEKASGNFILGDIRLDSDILLVGEAPGQDEDEQGRPFVGRAGERLDDTLLRVGLDRAKVSVTNVFPRRPDRNREPSAKEVAAQIPFLKRLVGLHANLKGVGLLGGNALQARTGQEKIESYRGEQFLGSKFPWPEARDGDVWYVPALHPAAVLYQQSSLKWLVQDLAWLKTLAGGEYLDVSNKSFEFIDDGASLVSFFPDIHDSPISYVDIESASPEGVSPLWWWDPRVYPVLMSFAWLEGGEPQALVVEANGSTFPVIRDLLASNPKHWGGASGLYFDFPLLRRLGMEVKCWASPLDSYPIARLNDENRGNGLKDLAKQHLRAVGHTPYWGEGEEEAWHSRWREWPSMGQADRKERIRYSGLDAWLGIQALQKEAERLKRKTHLVRAYTGIVLPQAQAIEEMNAEGLPLDVEAAEARAEELEAKKIILTAGLQALVPEAARPKKKVTRTRKKEAVVTYEPIEDINFMSYIQLKQMLFEGSGLPSMKKTRKTGGDASDEEVLLKLLDLEPAGKYPAWAFEVVRGALEIRGAVKERGYVESLLKYARLSHDGRVHSTFKIGPVTWRLASENPNVQQLSGPVKALFRAPDGWKFVKHDHNALEVRGLADQSGDPVLIGRIRRGMDLHWVHAAGFLGWSYDDTLPTAKEGDNKKIRFAFKTLFFACVPTTTKILTKRGWLIHDQIIPGQDETLGYQDGRLEWTRINKVHFYRNAPLTRLWNRYFSATFTPGHRWLLKRRTRRGGTRQSVIELRAGAITTEDTLILSAPAAGGVSDITPDEAALIAWLYTDGHVRWSQDRSHERRANGKLYAPSQAWGKKVGVWACIFQRKSHPELRSLMGRLGGRAYKGPSGTVVYGIPPQVIRDLWQKAGLPTRSLEDLVLSLTPQARRAFFEAGMLAEGGTTKGSPVFYQNAGPVLEAFRLAAFLEGNLPLEHNHSQLGYPLGRGLTISKPRVTGQRLKQDTFVGIADVWCVETDLETWVAREGNQIFLTGNSGYGGGAPMLAVTVRKEFHDAGIGTDIVLHILSERGIGPGEDPYVTLATEWLKWLRKEYKVLRASFFRYGAPDDEGESPDKYPVWRDRLVRSKFGFERRVPEIRDYDEAFISEAHRQAYNFPSQNLSVLTFLSYRDLRQRRADMGLDMDARLCLQEHDSTMWLVRDEVVDLWEAVVRVAMETREPGSDAGIDWSEWKADFAVPLRVEGLISNHWE